MGGHYNENCGDRSALDPSHGSSIKQITHHDKNPDQGRKRHHVMRHFTMRGMLPGKLDE